MIDVARVTKNRRLTEFEQAELKVIVLNLQYGTPKEQEAAKRKLRTDYVWIAGKNLADIR